MFLLKKGVVRVKIELRICFEIRRVFMQKSITKVLGIKYPIIQGGMAWISEAKLASSVSNAGGAGIISSGGRTTEYVRDQIRLAKTLTNKPFGVNVMLMAPNKQEIVDVICEEKPAFVTLGAGNPVPFFSQFKAAGIKVLPVVPNVKLAKRVEKAGADAVIAEGMEAGGHIGVLTTMALMTQVIPEVEIPVIAAGGFGDGRGIAAALIMGAAGVQLGTRFLIAEECTVHDNMKQKLIEAVDTDSIVTGLTLGSAVRGIKNKFSLDFVALEAKGTSREELLEMVTGTNKLAAVDGDTENGMMQAGQSLTPLQKVEPVKDIIETLIQETKDALAKAAEIKL
jgi:enoyl-[acyl-carrier protein] reductase II